MCIHIILPNCLALDLNSRNSFLYHIYPPVQLNLASYGSYKKFCSKG